MPRNQLESLLCMLSTGSTPNLVYRNDDDNITVLSIGHWFLHPAVYYEVSFLYCYGAPSTQKSFSLSSIVVHGQFMKLLINTSNIPIFSLSTQHHQRHLLHPRHRRVVLYGHGSGNYSDGSLSSLHRLLQFHSLSNFIVFGKNESKSASLHSQKLEIFSIYQ
ncbi:hypothetical protein JHK82_042838 [Glycine max]|nr:hypothetical protein JHK86_042855 [Glycine max]KAG5105868.1 hypothetical protein JHK82_042838 [Glycine max]